ncbi:hypothetical protein ABW19_dt0210536 [Dactylella cylindrospora]|nr:hypothetical protein ABW19_dt0210536 [Dactylella cylindrospora]
MPGPTKIYLGGTSYQIGYDHGRLLKEQIARQISIYYEMFAYTSKLDVDGVHQRAKEYQATIQSLVPHIYEEMVGIAKGAEVDIVDIISLNVRSEIALGEFNDGCTSVSCRVVDADGKAVQYLGQTWDWVRPVQENLAVIEIKQEGKPTIKMVTEAGIVGKIGYNSASVGVLLNALRSTPTDKTKLPIHIILRLCLESASKDEAIDTIQKYGAASAQHILIADPQGALSLELSPIENFYLQPVGGYLAHTNHPIENKAIRETLPFAGSHERLERACNLLESVPLEGLSTETLRARVFLDTANGFYAIYGTEDNSKPKWLRTMTLFNIVMCFRAGEQPSGEVVFMEGSEGGTGNNDVVYL